MYCQRTLSIPLEDYRYDLVERRLIDTVEDSLGAYPVAAIYACLRAVRRHDGRCWRETRITASLTVSGESDGDTSYKAMDLYIENLLWDPAGRYVLLEITANAIALKRPHGSFEGLKRPRVGDAGLPIWLSLDEYLVTGTALRATAWFFKALKRPRVGDAGLPRGLLSDAHLGTAQVTRRR